MVAGIRSNAAGDRWDLNMCSQHRRAQIARNRHAFTLIELLALTAVCACLLGWYIRALDDVDLARELMRDDDTIRFLRAYGGSPSPSGVSALDAIANSAGVMEEAHPVELQKAESSTSLPGAPTILFWPLIKLK